MCEVWNRRQELDAYEAVIVGIASGIEGTAFYEYHCSFSARAAALIQPENVKVDWGGGSWQWFVLLAVCRCVAAWHIWAISVLSWQIKNCSTNNFPEATVQIGSQIYKAGPGLA